MVDEVEHRSATLWIECSRHDSGRLVQQHIRERLRRNDTTVELDPVARLDERAQLTELAVDGHTSGFDQVIRLSPRRDAGAGKVRVEAHPRYCRAVAHYVSLMRWTSEGLAGLPAWRERVEEGERTIQEAGGRLVGVYVTLGRYDVVEIFEAPDDDVAVEILMKLQRFGAEHTETLRAFTRDEAEAIVKRL